jgi:hypothetical protein
MALIAGALVAGLLVPLASPAPVSAQASGLHGRVLSGATPLQGFDVTLYATTPGGGPDALATATSTADGSFDISYDVPANPGAVLYVLAENTATPPDPGDITLAAVLGRAPIPADVVVNERTTVASAYAMTQFTENGAIAGQARGLQNAANMVRNLVDLSSGDISPVLASSPNGGERQRHRLGGELRRQAVVAVLWRRPVEMSRRVHHRTGDLPGGDRLRIRRSHAQYRGRRRPVRERVALQQLEGSPDPGEPGRLRDGGVRRRRGTGDESSAPAAAAADHPTVHRLTDDLPLRHAPAAGFGVHAARAIHPGAQTV